MRQDYYRDFGPFEDHVWLNAAVHGAMPTAAAEAVHEAAQWKVSPHTLPHELFETLPDEMRRAIARLINADPEDVILTNSTSYGINLIANNYRWQGGEDVLLLENDYPANTLPWEAVKDRYGFTTRYLPTDKEMVKPNPAQIEEMSRERTAFLCACWVNTFSGYTLDIDNVSRALKSRNPDAKIILNVSQALGARALDVTRCPVDAIVSTGFKWLCGPYGTGFCWVSKKLQQQMDCNQTNWFVHRDPEDYGLNFMQELQLRDDVGIEKYDVFCTANFLNYLPWLATIKYFNQQGLENIEAYDSELAARLINGIKEKGVFTLTSPEEEAERSTIVCLTSGPGMNGEKIVEELDARAIHISLRQDKLRISPHLYNTAEEVERLLTELHSIR
jgi:selenocysteine lyase/cysteine desulfurase